MARATWLPEIEVHDHGVGFELRAPSEALLGLADSFCGEVLSAEITPDDGSVLVVRVTAGAVVVAHDGAHVEVVGGRDALDELAAWLRTLLLVRRSRPRCGITRTLSTIQVARGWRPRAGLSWSTLLRK